MTAVLYDDDVIRAVAFGNQAFPPDSSVHAGTSVQDFVDVFASSMCGDERKIEAILELCSSVQKWADEPGTGTCGSASGVVAGGVLDCLVAATRLVLGPAPAPTQRSVGSAMGSSAGAVAALRVLQVGHVHQLLRQQWVQPDGAPGHSTGAALGGVAGQDGQPTAMTAMASVTSCLARVATLACNRHSLHRRGLLPLCVHLLQHCQAVLAEQLASQPLASPAPARDVQDTLQAITGISLVLQLSAGGAAAGPRAQAQQLLAAACTACPTPREADPGPIAPVEDGGDRAEVLAAAHMATEGRTCAVLVQVAGLCLIAQQRSWAEDAAVQDSACTAHAACLLAFSALLALVPPLHAPVRPERLGEEGLGDAKTEGGSGSIFSGSSLLEPGALASLPGVSGGSTPRHILRPRRPPSLHLPAAPDEEESVMLTSCAHHSAVQVGVLEHLQVVLCRLSGAAQPHLAAALHCSALLALNTLCSPHVYARDIISVFFASFPSVLGLVTTPTPHSTCASLISNLLATPPPSLIYSTPLTTLTLSLALGTPPVHDPAPSSTCAALILTSTLMSAALAVRCPAAGGLPRSILRTVPYVKLLVKGSVRELAAGAASHLSSPSARSSAAPRHGSLVLSRPSSLPHQQAAVRGYSIGSAPRPGHASSPASRRPLRAPDRTQVTGFVPSTQPAPLPLLSRSRLTALVTGAVECVLDSSASLDAALHVAVSSIPPSFTQGDFAACRAAQAASGGSPWGDWCILQHVGSPPPSTVASLVDDCMQQWRLRAEWSRASSALDSACHSSAQGVPGAGDVALAMLHAMVLLEPLAAAVLAASQDVTLLLQRVAQPVSAVYGVGVDAAEWDAGSVSTASLHLVPVQQALAPPHASAGEGSRADGGPSHTRAEVLGQEEGRSVAWRHAVTHSTLATNSKALASGTTRLLQLAGYAAAQSIQQWVTGRGTGGLGRPWRPEDSASTAASDPQVRRMLQVNFCVVCHATAALLHVGSWWARCDFVTVACAEALQGLLRDQPLVLGDTLQHLQAQPVLSAWLHSVNCAMSVNAAALAGAGPHADVEGVMVRSAPVDMPLLPHLPAVDAAMAWGGVPAEGEDEESEAGAGASTAHGTAGTQPIPPSHNLPAFLAGARIDPDYWSVERRQGGPSAQAARRDSGAVAPVPTQRGRSHEAAEVSCGLHPRGSSSAALRSVWAAVRLAVAHVGILPRMHVLADLQRVSQQGLSGHLQWQWPTTPPSSPRQPIQGIAVVSAVLSPDAVQRASLLHCIAGLLVWPWLRPQVVHTLGLVFATGEPVLERAAVLELSAARNISQQRQRELAQPADYGAPTLHSPGPSPPLQRSQSGRGVPKLLYRSQERRSRPPQGQAGHLPLPAWTVATVEHAAGEVRRGLARYRLDASWRAAGAAVRGDLPAAHALLMQLTPPPLLQCGGGVRPVAPIQTTGAAPERLLNGWLNAGLRESRRTVAAWWSDVAQPVLISLHEHVGELTRASRLGQRPSSRQAQFAQAAAARAKVMLLHTASVWNGLMAAMVQSCLPQVSPPQALARSSEGAEPAGDAPAPALPASLDEGPPWLASHGVPTTVPAASPPNLAHWEWVISLAHMSHMPLRLALHPNSQRILQGSFAAAADSLALAAEALPKLAGADLAPARTALLSVAMHALQAVSACLVGAPAAATLLPATLRPATCQALLDAALAGLSEAGSCQGAVAAEVCVALINVAVDGALAPVAGAAQFLTQPHLWPKGSLVHCCVTHDRVLAGVLPLLHTWLEKLHVTVVRDAACDSAGRALVEGHMASLLPVLRVLHALVSPVAGSTYAALNAHSVAHATSIAVSTSMDIVCTLGALWAACTSWGSRQVSLREAQQGSAVEDLSSVPPPAHALPMCLLLAADVAGALCRGNADVHGMKRLLRSVGDPASAIARVPHAVNMDPGMLQEFCLLWLGMLSVVLCHSQRIPQVVQRSLGGFGLLAEQPSRELAQGGLTHRRPAPVNAYFMLPSASAGIQCLRREGMDAVSPGISPWPRSGFSIVLWFRLDPLGKVLVRPVMPPPPPPVQASTEQQPPQVTLRDPFPWHAPCLASVFDGSGRRVQVNLEQAPPPPASPGSAPRDAQRFVIVASVQATERGPPITLAAEDVHILPNEWHCVAVSIASSVSQPTPRPRVEQRAQREPSSFFSFFTSQGAGAKVGPEAGGGSTLAAPRVTRGQLALAVNGAPMGRVECPFPEFGHAAGPTQVTLGTAPHEEVTLSGVALQSVMGMGGLGLPALQRSGWAHDALPRDWGQVQLTATVLRHMRGRLANVRLFHMPLRMDTLCAVCLLSGDVEGGSLLQPGEVRARPEASTLHSLMRAVQRQSARRPGHPAELCQTALHAATVKLSSEMGEGPVGAARGGSIPGLAAPSPVQPPTLGLTSAAPPSSEPDPSAASPSAPPTSQLASSGDGTGVPDVRPAVLDSWEAVTSPHTMPLHAIPSVLRQVQLGPPPPSAPQHFGMDAGYAGRVLGSARPTANTPWEPLASTLHSVAGTVQALTDSGVQQTLLLALSTGVVDSPPGVSGPRPSMQLALNTVRAGQGTWRQVAGALLGSTLSINRTSGGESLEAVGGLPLLLTALPAIATGVRGGILAAEADGGAAPPPGTGHLPPGQAAWCLALDLVRHLLRVPKDVQGTVLAESVTPFMNRARAAVLGFPQLLRSLAMWVAGTTAACRTDGARALRATFLRATFHGVMRMSVLDDQLRQWVWWRRCFRTAILMDVAGWAHAGVFALPLTHLSLALDQSASAARSACQGTGPLVFALCKHLRYSTALAGLAGHDAACTLQALRQCRQQRGQAFQVLIALLREGAAASRLGPGELGLVLAAPLYLRGEAAWHCALQPATGLEEMCCVLETQEWLGLLWAVLVEDNVWDTASSAELLWGALNTAHPAATYALTHSGTTDRAVAALDLVSAARAALQSHLVPSAPRDFGEADVRACCAALGAALGCVGPLHPSGESEGGHTRDVSFMSCGSGFSQAPPADQAGPPASDAAALPGTGLNVSSTSAPTRTGQEEEEAEATEASGCHSPGGSPVVPGQAHSAASPGCVDSQAEEDEEVGPAPARARAASAADVDSNVSPDIRGRAGTGTSASSRPAPARVFLPVTAPASGHTLEALLALCLSPHYAIAQLAGKVTLELLGWLASRLQAALPPAGLPDAPDGAQASIGPECPSLAAVQAQTSCVVPVGALAACQPSWAVPLAGVAAAAHLAPWRDGVLLPYPEAEALGSGDALESPMVQVLSGARHARLTLQRLASTAAQGVLSSAKGGCPIQVARTADTSEAGRQVLLWASALLPTAELAASAGEGQCHPCPLSLQVDAMALVMAACTGSCAARDASAGGVMAHPDVRILGLPPRVPWWGAGLSTAAAPSPGFAAEADLINAGAGTVRASATTPEAGEGLLGELFGQVDAALPRLPLPGALLQAVNSLPALPRAVQRAGMRRAMNVLAAAVESGGASAHGPVLAVMGSASWCVPWLRLLGLSLRGAGSGTQPTSKPQANQLQTLLVFSTSCVTTMLRTAAVLGGVQRPEPASPASDAQARHFRMPSSASEEGGLGWRERSPSGASQPGLHSVGSSSSLAGDAWGAVEATRPTWLQGFGAHLAGVCDVLVALRDGDGDAPLFDAPMAVAGMLAHQTYLQLARSLPASAGAVPFLPPQSNPGSDAGTEHAMAGQSAPPALLSADQVQPVTRAAGHFQEELSIWVARHATRDEASAAPAAASLASFLGYVRDWVCCLPPGSAVYTKPEDLLTPPRSGTPPWAFLANVAAMVASVGTGGPGSSSQACAALIHSARAQLLPMMAWLHEARPWVSPPSPPGAPSAQARWHAHRQQALPLVPWTLGTCSVSPQQLQACLEAFSRAVAGIARRAVAAVTRSSLAPLCRLLQEATAVAAMASCMAGEGAAGIARTAQRAVGDLLPSVRPAVAQALLGAGLAPQSLPQHVALPPQLADSPALKPWTAVLQGVAEAQHLPGSMQEQVAGLGSQWLLLCLGSALHGAPEVQPPAAGVGGACPHAALQAHTLQCGAEVLWRGATVGTSLAAVLAGPTLRLATQAARLHFRVGTASWRRLHSRLLAPSSPWNELASALGGRRGAGHLAPPRGRTGQGHTEQALTVANPAVAALNTPEHSLEPRMAVDGWSDSLQRRRRLVPLKAGTYHKWALLFTLVPSLPGHSSLHVVEAGSPPTPAAAGTPTSLQAGHLGPVAASFRSAEGLNVWLRDLLWGPETAESPPHPPARVPADSTDAHSARQPAERDGRVEALTAEAPPLPPAPTSEVPPPARRQSSIVRQRSRSTPMRRAAAAAATPTLPDSIMEELRFDLLLLACVGRDPAATHLHEDNAGRGGLLARVGRQFSRGVDGPGSALTAADLLRDMRRRMASPTQWYGISPSDASKLWAEGPLRGAAPAPLGGAGVALGMAGSRPLLPLGTGVGGWQKGLPASRGNTLGEEEEGTVVSFASEPSANFLPFIPGAPASSHRRDSVASDVLEGSVAGEGVTVPASDAGSVSTEGGSRVSGARPRHRRTATGRAPHRYLHTQGSAAGSSDAHSAGGTASQHGASQHSAGAAEPGGPTVRPAAPHSKGSSTGILFSALCECVTPLQSTLGVVEVRTGSLSWRPVAGREADLLRKYALGPNHWASNHAVPNEVHRFHAEKLGGAEGRHPMALWLQERFGGDVQALHSAVLGQLGGAAGVYARRLNKHSILAPTGAWSIKANRIVSLERRRYMLQPTALEVFAAPGGSSGGSTAWLLAFPEPTPRDALVQVLLSLPKTNMAPYLATDEDVRRVAVRVYLRWRDRLMSNFEFLAWCNRLAGRTYNDPAQYPVFPWVLADYTSATLDLRDPAVFRDLRYPMGAQSEARREHMAARYDDFADNYSFTLQSAQESVAQAMTWFIAAQRGGLSSHDARTPAEIVQQAAEEAHGKVEDVAVTGPPMHYGSHYSNASFTAWYLLRVEPWTSYHVVLHDGKFDAPNRQLRSIAAAFAGATSNDSDVKELPPEMYYAPEYLTMQRGMCLGMVSTEEGDRPLRDVELPPWAHGSPHRFVTLMRAALESEHVSAHLHSWVELVFGHRQYGPYHPWASHGDAAVQSLNVYNYRLYDGPFVNLLPQLRSRRPSLWRSTMTSLESFGQQPAVLFTDALPARHRLGSIALHVPLFSRSHGHSDAVDGWARTSVGLLSEQASPEPQEEGELAVLEPGGRRLQVHVAVATKLLQAYNPGVSPDTPRVILDRGSASAIPLVVMVGPGGHVALATSEDVRAAAQNGGLVPPAALERAGFDMSRRLSPVNASPRHAPLKGKASPVEGSPVRGSPERLVPGAGQAASGSADLAAVTAGRVGVVPRNIILWLASHRHTEVVHAAWEQVKAALAIAQAHEHDVLFERMFRDAYCDEESRAHSESEGSGSDRTPPSTESEPGSSNGSGGGASPSSVRSVWPTASLASMAPHTERMGLSLHTAPIVQLSLCCVADSDQHGNSAVLGSGDVHGTGTLLTLDANGTLGLHQWRQVRGKGMAGAGLRELALDGTLPAAATTAEVLGLPLAPSRGVLMGGMSQKALQLTWQGKGSFRGDVMARGRLDSALSTAALGSAAGRAGGTRLSPRDGAAGGSASLMRRSASGGLDASAPLVLPRPLLARLPTDGVGNASAAAECIAAARRAMSRAHVAIPTAAPRLLGGVSVLDGDVPLPSTPDRAASNVLPTQRLTADASGTHWVVAATQHQRASRDGSGLPSLGSSFHGEEERFVGSELGAGASLAAPWLRPWRTAVLSGGRHLVSTGHADGTFKVTDLATGEVVCSVSASGAPTLCVAACAVGHRTATAGAVGALGKSNTSGHAGSGPAVPFIGEEDEEGGDGAGQAAAVAEQPSRQRWVDVSARDGSLFVDSRVWTLVATDVLVVGSADATVRVWACRMDSAVPRLRCVLHAHTAPVLCVAADTRLDTVLSSGADGVLAVHALHDGRSLCSVTPPARLRETPLPLPLTWCGLSPAGVIVAYSAAEETLWSYSLMGEALAGPVPARQQALAFAWTEDGESLLVGGTSHFVVVYNAQTLEVQQFLGAGGTPMRTVPRAVEDAMLLAELRARSGAGGAALKADGAAAQLGTGRDGGHGPEDPMQAAAPSPESAGSVASSEGAECGSPEEDARLLRDARQRRLAAEVSQLPPLPSAVTALRLTRGERNLMVGLHNGSVMVFNTDKEVVIRQQMEMLLDEVW